MDNHVLQRRQPLTNVEVWTRGNEYPSHRCTGRIVAVLAGLDDGWRLANGEGVARVRDDEEVAQASVSVRMPALWQLRESIDACVAESVPETPVAAVEACRA